MESYEKEFDSSDCDDIELEYFSVNSCGKSEESAQTRASRRNSENVAITKVAKSSVEDFYEATGTVKAKTTTQVFRRDGQNHFFSGC